MIEYLYGSSYDMEPVYVDCGDVGHQGARRARVYVFLWHKERVCRVRPVEEVYQKVAATMQKWARTQPSDYLLAGRQEVLREAEDLAFRRRMQIPAARIQCVFSARGR